MQQGFNLSYIPYICRVSQLTIIKKQLIAGLLAAVLLVITGVKFFHSCNEEVEIEVGSNVEQISKNAHCAICDFHFAQDVDLTIAPPSTDSPLFSSNITYACQASNFQSSIGLSFSDRGPPALL